MAGDTTKTLHNVTTEKNYTNTRLIQMSGRIFKFYHEITNGTNRFTVELFDGNKFNYITSRTELGIEAESPNYRASYVSSLEDKKMATDYVVAKGKEFIRNLF
jgi:hypothetical protein